MKFDSRKEFIEDGDLVIALLQPDYLPITVRDGDTTDTKFGSFKHNSFIGKKFGTKVISDCKKKGHMYLLFPSCHLWMKSLLCRTQLIYSTNISQIISILDVKPNSTIIEAGTGSGSLSHALISATLPNGHLYTFEFNKLRFESVQKDFLNHFSKNNVTIMNVDIVEQGFPICIKVDAIVLDLPNPWCVVKHSTQVLKPFIGKICTFSPSIEQIQKTIISLKDHSFCEFTIFECLEKPYVIREVNLDTSVKNNQRKRQNNKSTVNDLLNNSDGDLLTSNFIPENQLTLYDEKGVPNELSDKKCILSTCSKAIPGHTGYILIANYSP